MSKAERSRRINTNDRFEDLMVLSYKHKSKCHGVIYDGSDEGHDVLRNSLEHCGRDGVPEMEGRIAE